VITSPATSAMPSRLPRGVRGAHREARAEALEGERHPEDRDRDPGGRLDGDPGPRGPAVDDEAQPQVRDRRAQPAVADRALDGEVQVEPAGALEHQAAVGREAQAEVGLEGEPAPQDRASQRARRRQGQPGPGQADRDPGFVGRHRRPGLPDPDPTATKRGDRHAADGERAVAGVRLAVDLVVDGWRPHRLELETGPGGEGELWPLNGTPSTPSP
jgi:hypothetical protein